MIDHTTVKLGKRPPRTSPKTLRLSRYLTPALPPPPATVTNSRGVKEWGMMLNDKLGCCTIAGIAHAIQVMVLSNILPSSQQGIIHPSDEIILRYYEKLCGYDPEDPETDQGGVELDILNSIRKCGFAGYSFLGYTAVNPANSLHVKQAINLFGGVYIGLEMPNGWQGSMTWDADMGQAGSWGGHCVFVSDYSHDGLTAITWGEMQPLTWGGLMQYCSEAYALVVTDWVPPSGFDKESLLVDLSSVTA